jgi:hypothetical protein
MSFANAHNRISETAENAAASTRQFVGEHAISTTAAAFGLGLGTGIALVLLMYNGTSQRSESNVVYRLGRQVLGTMADAVPDSISALRRH